MTGGESTVVPDFIMREVIFLLLLCLSRVKHMFILVFIQEKMILFVSVMEERKRRGREKEKKRERERKNIHSSKISSIFISMINI